jgi:hypothetical protein
MRRSHTGNQQVDIDAPGADARSSTVTITDEPFDVTNEFPGRLMAVIHAADPWCQGPDRTSPCPPDSIPRRRLT